MGYVENNLGKNEIVVKSASRTMLYLVGTWLKGLLLCFLIVPVYRALKRTVMYFWTDLAITNKKVVGRVRLSWFKTTALDAPLNKVQNVSVEQGFFGKIFNYGTITVLTAAGSVMFMGIKSPDAFKGMLMSQIDEYEEERVKQQAAEMANAMSSVLNKE